MVLKQPGGQGSSTAKQMGLPWGCPDAKRAVYAICSLNCRCGRDSQGLCFDGVAEMLAKTKLRCHALIMKAVNWEVVGNRRNVAEGRWNVGLLSAW